MILSVYINRNWSKNGRYNLISVDLTLIRITKCRHSFRIKIGLQFSAHTHREILLNQTEIRLYSPCTDWFGTQTDVRLVPSQWENSKYNLIPGQLKLDIFYAYTRDNFEHFMHRSTAKIPHFVFGKHEEHFQANFYYGPELKWV